MADEKRIITVNQGTSTEWQSQVRTQESGEMGLSTDTRELKIGDGTTAFDDIPTLLEVENAANIKAALEGNTSLSASNAVADVSQLVAIGGLIAARIEELFEREQTLEGEIDAAQTADEAEAVTWDE